MGKREMRGRGGTVSLGRGRGSIQNRGAPKRHAGFSSRSCGPSEASHRKEKV